MMQELVSKRRKIQFILLLFVSKLFSKNLQFYFNIRFYYSLSIARLLPVDSK